ncbi:MAG: FAD-dependent oxidoreductase [Pseudomonadales bacterium]|nr:FAD-dependent oxidoreductase [Pseudomonadales bacterium]MCP5303574.1 FAD-dependent oxidoreductase [Pseudomonadales bacterium]
MPDHPEQTINVDIAIIGGGIAGLWLLNRLVSAGYNAILFEQSALGSDQTVASQGMIHGGIKYTLGGTLSGASEAIADMPDHWRACLRGEGDVDLTGVGILSDHFFMWSSNSAVSKMSTFFASKATRGRVQKVKPAQRPEIFQHSGFKGSLYKLVDMVLNVPEVVKKLADNHPNRIFKIDWSRAQWSNDNGVAAIDFEYHGKCLRLNATQFILSAGRGNEQLLNALGAQAPKTQTRPLQQVMIKHHYPHRFFGHCLGAETTPRLTISSHPCEDGSQVWYLGGSLAEKGVHQSPEDVIACAKQELGELLPWVDLSAAKWAALPVDRAEPRQRNFARPDKAFAAPIDSRSNVLATWPTKLTLSPNLADEVIALLQTRGVKPAHAEIPKIDFLSRPTLAPTPWQTAFESSTEEVNHAS